MVELLNRSGNLILNSQFLAVVQGARLFVILSIFVEVHVAREPPEFQIQHLELVGKSTFLFNSAPGAYGVKGSLAHDLHKLPFQFELVDPKDIREEFLLLPRHPLRLVASIPTANIIIFLLNPLHYSGLSYVLYGRILTTCYVFRLRRAYCSLSVINAFIDHIFQYFDSIFSCELIHDGVHELLQELAHYLGRFLLVHGGHLLQCCAHLLTSLLNLLLDRIHDLSGYTHVCCKFSVTWGWLVVINVFK